MQDIFFYLANADLPFYYYYYFYMCCKAWRVFCFFFKYILLRKLMETHRVNTRQCRIQYINYIMCVIPSMVYFLCLLLLLIYKLPIFVFIRREIILDTILYLVIFSFFWLQQIFSNVLFFFQSKAIVAENHNLYHIVFKELENGLFAK